MIKDFFQDYERLKKYVEKLNKEGEINDLS